MLIVGERATWGSGSGSHGYDKSVADYSIRSRSGRSSWYCSASGFKGDNWYLLWSKSGDRAVICPYPEYGSKSGRRLI